MNIQIQKCWIQIHPSKSTWSTRKPHFYLGDFPSYEASRVMYSNIWISAFITFYTNVMYSDSFENSNTSRKHHVSKERDGRANSNIRIHHAWGFIWWEVAHIKMRPQWSLIVRPHWCLPKHYIFCRAAVWIRIQKCWVQTWQLNSNLSVLKHKYSGGNSWQKLLSLNSVD